LGSASVALLLLVSVGLVLGQAEGPEGSPIEGLTGALNEDAAGEADVGSAAAIVDDGFWYQGRLTDAQGNPLPNASIEVTFRLYDGATSATVLDETTVMVDTDGNGLFNEELDFNNAELFNGEARYLSLQVTGEASEMTPRQYLRPVPYALSIRPGAVIEGSITLGGPGANGYLYVKDSADVEVLRFSGSSGYLSLGGPGEDGDLVVTNQGPTTTFQVDGLQGAVYVYDGVGETSAHRLFEFDSGFAPAEGNSKGAIWGDQSNNLGNLSLKSNDDVDVYLEQTDPGNSTGYFRVFNGAGEEVYSVRENGNTAAAGLKAAVVETEDYGKRALYALESPEVWFEDFGTGQLTNGQATVVIELLYRQTINAGVGYHVFVTPLGDCNGLLVTNKTADSFEVRELGGGRADVAFDYRIVAKRLGYEDQRLQERDSLATEVPGPGGRPGASEPEAELEPPGGQQ
jgi:hypothetical protein